MASNRIGQTIRALRRLLSTPEGVAAVVIPMIAIAGIFFNARVRDAVDAITGRGEYDLTVTIDNPFNEDIEVSRVLDVYLVSDQSDHATLRPRGDLISRVSLHDGADQTRFSAALGVGAKSSRNLRGTLDVKQFQDLVEERSSTVDFVLHYGRARNVLYQRVPLHPVHLRGLDLHFQVESADGAERTLQVLEESGLKTPWD